MRKRVPTVMRKRVGLLLVLIVMSRRDMQAPSSVAFTARLLGTQDYPSIIEELLEVVM